MVPGSGSRREFHPLAPRRSRRDRLRSPGFQQAAALIAGGSVTAARAIAREVDRAVNFCGGLHHAMANDASGFWIDNAAALSMTALLAQRVRKVAYIDVDAHHADGVQPACYGDPRVLTVSMTPDPLSLFPFTGFPTVCGAGAADGTSVNIAVPAGTTDTSWLRPSTPSFREWCGPCSPRWVTQHGTDSPREDPRADLELTVDGQRASSLALRKVGRLGLPMILDGDERCHPAG